jgi:hypothetical protein
MNNNMLYYRNYYNLVNSKENDEQSVAKAQL